LGGAEEFEIVSDSKFQNSRLTKRDLEFETWNLKFYGVIMPNPKRRHSHARTRTRRAHDALKTPQFYTDKDSGEAKVPHRIDAKTGMYKGRKIIDIKDAE